MTEYYHTLLEKGGRLLKDGEVVQETDYQILGHKAEAFPSGEPLHEESTTDLATARTALSKEVL